MKHMLSGATILVLMAALVAGGCATTGGGASDDEQVAALLAQWKDAAVKADADALMATYSESFTHDGYEYDAEDKDALTEYIEYAIDEGNFDGVEIAMDDADIEIDGSKASVYPIDFAVSAGTVTIELLLTKEKSGWFITDMIIEGI